MSEADREAAIRRELLAGNLPDFLRTALPVTVVSRVAGAPARQLTFCVLPDYLSIGADGDFLRIPMGLQTALSVAAEMGFTLPTRRMVDLIYSQATVHLSPQPLPAGSEMRSTAYYLRHQRLVQQQLDAINASPKALTAGHKKDLVLSSRLWREADRVAIYGWHRKVNSPIQPLSTVHGAPYADYSHGVRLIGEVVHVDGQPRSIHEVLADPKVAELLSDEGPLPGTSVRLSGRGSLDRSHRE